MYSSSSSGGTYRRNQHEYYDVANMTHCKCKPPHPLVQKVSWTPTNPGRRFKSCPTRGCKVYGFLDPELPSQYYIDLLYREHEEKLHFMNENVTGVENAQNSDQNIGMLEKEMVELKIKSKFHDLLFLLVALVFVIFFIMFVKVA